MKVKKKELYEAVLIDLDGTLIDINLEEFIPAYVKALSGRFTDLIRRDDFIAHLFGATAVMVQNDDPGKINQEIFYEEFCNRIGYSYQEIEPIINDFYAKDFPLLNCWGNKVPYALEVVELVRGKKIPLVLATNPIFPPEAVTERLSWAGLETSQFDLITTMNNMHFCKPNPAYYIEITEKIGCSPQGCLMAGNDTLEDLIALETGMETFLVDDYILHRDGVKLAYHYRGSLQDLVALLQEL